MKTGKALDIGCGIGTSVRYLAEKGFDVSGVGTSKVASRKKIARQI
jgi:cyclopropane fatty-acyl-phospholipid synthase-like methyltransferase